MPQYIDKDALVAEMERRINAYQKNFDKADNKIARLSIDGRIAGLKSLLSFLNTLEVKEVNFDSNIRAYLTNHFNVYEGGVLQSKKSSHPLSTYDIIKVAKHFFELGMAARNKVQKGE